MSSAGASACSICTAGSFSQFPGGSECSMCPAGKFLTDTGTDESFHDSLADCNMCTSGKTTAGEGASQETECYFECEIGESL